MLVAGAEAGRARVGPTAITPIPGSGCVADEEARRSAAALVDRSFGNIGLFNGVSAPRSWNIGCADSRGRRLVWFWHGTETAKYFVVDARRARLLLQSSSAETLEFVAATELNGDMVDEWIVVRRGELTTNYGLKEYLVLGTSLSRPLAVLPREAQFPPLPVRLSSGVALASDAGMFSVSLRGRLARVADGPEPSGILALRAVTNEVATLNAALIHAVYPGWRSTTLPARREAALTALVGLGVEASRASTLVDAVLPAPAP